LWRDAAPKFEQQAATAGRGGGLAVVLGLHVLVAWAFASGVAHEVVAVVKKPIQMSIVPEAPPPPPPPPPKVEKIKQVPKVETAPPPAYVPPPDITPVAPQPAPVITAVQAEPPKEPVQIQPPATPAPPAVVKKEISLACPGYQGVLEQVLAEAFDRVGIVGTVRTLIKVRGSQVVDALPQSGPAPYYKYVQSAVRRMKCSAGGADEVLVTLDVMFAR
jgi:protein TonB